jgi:dipeptidyl aminopeptidase/acylaminoacyl peptidase
MTDQKQKRPFEAEAELRYSSIQDAKFSPDGRRVVYALSAPDLEADKDITNLWVYSLSDGYTFQLTRGDKDNHPEWSPDGQQIAFLSSRTGTTQVYIIALHGGEARQITEMKQGVASGPHWSPDGSKIAFTAGRQEQPPDLSRPYRITRFVYRLDGVGYLDRAVQNIYVIAAQGGEPRQLTDDAHIDRGLHWSPDGKKILYLAACDPDRDDLFSAKIHTVDMDGEVEEILGLDWGMIFDADWTPGGKNIVFGGIEAGKGMGSKGDLWVVDPLSGAIDCRTQGLKIGDLYGNFQPLDSEYVLAGVLREGMVEIYKMSLRGIEECTPLLKGKRYATLLDSNPKRILFNQSLPHDPSQLFIANMDGSSEQCLISPNRNWLQQIDLPSVENIHFKNEEGIALEGWVMLPTVGKPPYPTILYIHGGPHGAYGYGFRGDFQMLAGAGYAVLYINPRGSAGYGDNFSTALSGNWGMMDYKDLMAGVDYVIEKGIADPERMGVCGLSYGGFMTTFTVGQTDRFKAAVAENPITDLVSRYGTADMGPWGSIGEIGGKPHEIPEVYRRSSPITYAHRCTTPTLLIQGEADYRCPAGQSEQFYTHLKANGCIAEMLRLPGQPHIGSINGPYNVRRAQNDALLDWMDRYVRKKTG